MRSRKLFGSALLAILLLAQGTGVLGQDGEAPASCASVDVSLDACIETGAFAEVAQQLADVLVQGRGMDPVKFGRQVSMFIMDNLDVMSEVETNLDLPTCTSLYDSITTGSIPDLVEFATGLIDVTYSKAISDPPPDTILDVTSFECAASCCGACTEDVAYSFWDGWLDDAYCVLKVVECTIRTAACIAVGGTAVAACSAICAAPPWLPCIACIAAAAVGTEAACTDCLNCWSKWKEDCWD